jgi:hypothetical protein
MVKGLNSLVPDQATDRCHQAANSTVAPPALPRGSLRTASAQLFVELRTSRLTIHRTTTSGSKGS